jgi:predicted nucleotidyltransferase
MCDGVSVSQVSLVLKNFESLGIVRVEALPPAKLYTLNASNFGTKALFALLSQFDEVLQRAGAHIASWPEQPKAVWLYGSAARGRANSESDIDLVFVWSKEVWDRAPANTNLSEFGQWMLDATGNEANFLNISMSELKVMLQNEAALLGQLRRDAKVVWGATPEDLLAKR